MAKLTTFKEAAELLDIDPGNPDFVALFLAALDLADEKSELEYRAEELAEKIAGLIEQMQLVTAAEVAQRITEIRTMKRRNGQ